MTTATVCFSIDGGFLTAHCRELVLSKRWRDALRMLTEGLEGISADQALSILRGTHALVGVNAVDLVEDPGGEDTADYLATLAFQYAGLWRRPGDGHWLPYARVTHLGSEDVPDFPRGQGEQKKRWGTARVLHYADDPKADRCTDLEALDDLGVGILWHKVADPPLWIEGLTDPGAVLAQYREQGGKVLHARGASDGGREQPILVPDWRAISEMGPDDPTPPMRPLEDGRDLHAAGAEMLDEADVPLADRLVLSLGLDGKMAEAVEAIFGDKKEGAPIPDAELSHESGYILPDGTFYGCKYMHHGRLAERLLRHLHGVEVKDPQIEADRRNWLRIQASVTGGFAIMSPKGRPTKRQERTLADWCIAHRTPYPEELR